MKRLIFIPFDQLHFDYGALRGADPQSDVLVLVESSQKIRSYQFSRHRLFFYLSSARHFASEMKSRGFEVVYEQAANIPQGILAVSGRLGIDELISTSPSTFSQQRILSELGVKFIENDFFLTPRQIFSDWAAKQKSFVMENFYREQRKRLSILVDGEKPIGGQWNFDKENRLPPPKHYTWPPYLTHELDEIDLKVADEIGYTPSGTWATTRKGALAQLNNFVEHHLPSFGPYEDAMTTENWALHHSLLSPYFNIGLLHPKEVIEAAISAYEAGRIPIACAEGFVRQIIGWREYVNGMYWFLGPDYQKRNELGAHRDLPPALKNSVQTNMNCVGSIVRDIDERAWVHHIPRLMVLSNLALLSGVNPQQFLNWMREVFIDATEWVMVPNVIGMGLHADGGQMMTKPYVAGGAYISKMSNYCKGCKYNPKLRTGDDACPFTTLYWNFLERHEDRFASNHRMKQQYVGLNRLTDRVELRQRSVEVLDLLENGEL